LENNSLKENLIKVKI